jgi:hypothetical protein
MRDVERGTGNRRLLEAAGYVWDERMGDWSHPKSGRKLGGRIASVLTLEQLATWIADGDHLRA